MMGKIIKIIIIAGFLFFIGKNTAVAQTDNRDVDSSRDRTAIICDPVENPRSYRGEVIDCSGYPQPTSSQPTPTPSGGTGGVPTATPIPSSNGGSTGDEDACAPGKSYTGPYCGWSPEKDKPSGDGGTFGEGEVPRIGGPVVLGLSSTSGGELTLSDIMLLTGVLCLLLYVRSKTSVPLRRP